MNKKSELDLTTKPKLVDRQRKLWAHAEATKVAIEKISAASSSVKKSTVRKNFNKASTDRKPEFTIGKK